jgi:hypothetical protein
MSYGLIGEILGLAGGAGLVKGAYDDLKNAGSEAQAYSQQVGQQVQRDSAFKPFSVRTGSGSANVNRDGGVNVNLNGQQQRQVNQLNSLATQMYGEAGQDLDQRELDVYGRIRAAQSPEEERQRLALEERLVNQGRGGVRTSMFGGTPEQLAMEKAIAESRNNAMLGAMTQAGQEQQRYATLGSLFQNNSYLPQAQMLNALNAGFQGASLADVGRRQGAQAYGTAAMGGLDAKTASRIGQSNMMGNLGMGLLSGILTPQYSAEGDLLGGGIGGLFDQIGDIDWSSIF